MISVLLDKRRILNQDFQTGSESYKYGIQKISITDPQPRLKPTKMLTNPRKMCTRAMFFINTYVFIFDQFSKKLWFNMSITNYHSLFLYIIEA